MPTPIVEDLEARGCTIPQSDVGSRPQNAIQGRFYRPSQTDWAVLCSRKGESSLLVYARGSASEVEELARREEEFTFDVLEDGVTRFGFDRMISPVGKRYILEHHSHHEGPGEPPPTPDLPPIDHEGIDDAWPEKASIVRYWWRDSGWVELAGAD